MLVGSFFLQQPAAAATAQPPASASPPPRSTCHHSASTITNTATNPNAGRVRQWQPAEATNLKASRLPGRYSRSRGATATPDSVTSVLTGTTVWAGQHGRTSGGVDSVEPACWNWNGVGPGRRWLRAVADGGRGRPVSQPRRRRRGAIRGAAPAALAGFLRIAAGRRAGRAAARCGVVSRTGLAGPGGTPAVWAESRAGGPAIDSARHLRRAAGRQWLCLGLVGHVALWRSRYHDPSRPAHAEAPLQDRSSRLQGDSRSNLNARPLRGCHGALSRWFVLAQGSETNLASVAKGALL